MQHPRHHHRHLLLLLLLLLPSLCAVAGAAEEEKKGKSPQNPYAFLDGEPVLVGRGSASTHFWKPRAYPFGVNRTLVTVELNDDADCGCSDSPRVLQARTAPCLKACSTPGRAAYVSADDAATFSRVEGAGGFCVAGGVEVGASRMCPEVDPATGEVRRVAWSVTNDKALHRNPSGVFTFPEGTDTRSLAFGPSVGNVGSTQHFWLISEEGQLALYTSSDNKNFTRVGPVPFSHKVAPQDLDTASLLRKKDNVLVAAVASPLGGFVTLQSRTQGKLWGTPTHAPSARNVPQFAATHYTTVTAGEGFAPSISYVRDAQKRNSKRSLAVASHHDIYSESFLEAKDADLKACGEAPYNKVCESTGVTTFAPLNAVTFGPSTNTTYFLMCYDKLSNGWAGPALPTTEEEVQSPKGDEVYCLRIRVSDEEPVEKLLAKARAHEEKQSRQKEQDEARKARVEQERKDREERSKEREKVWEEIDAVYIEAARKHEVDDGELVIVRDFQEEFKEFFE